MFRKVWGCWESFWTSVENSVIGDRSPEVIDAELVEPEPHPLSEEMVEGLLEGRRGVFVDRYL